MRNSEMLALASGLSLEGHDKIAMPLLRAGVGLAERLGPRLMSGAKTFMGAGRAAAPAVEGAIPSMAGFARTAATGAPTSSWFGRMAGRINPIMSGGGPGALPAATRFNIPGRMQNWMAGAKNPWVRAANWPLRMALPASYKGLIGGSLLTGAVTDRASMAERAQQAGDYATARVLNEMRGNPGMALGAAWGDPNQIASTLAGKGMNSAAYRYMQMAQDPSSAAQQQQQIERGLKWDWLPGVNNLGY